MEPSRHSKLRIIVSGLAGLHPVGGMAWHYLQYVLGLAECGHDVYYHEDTWSWPYDPVKRANTDVGDYSAAFINSFFERYAPDLRNRWHYRHLHETSFGMSESRFREIARTADLWINVSGACFIPEDLSSTCTKVFLDTDPGYNQIVLQERPDWSPNVDQWAALVDEHDRHFTYAENINGNDCTIPKVGLHWIPTRMPAVLDCWETGPASDDAAWTTIMSWSDFPGKLRHAGTEYFNKGPEFEKLLELPSRVDTSFCVAVGGTAVPGDALTKSGWRMVDGPANTLSPCSYAEFIKRSRAEISAAKHVYVATRSGWFSDRSTCYLACGRPVVVQDTAFSKILPVGEGILSFSTLEEAAEATRQVERDYQFHAAAAREIAEEYFDSGKVLGDLLEKSFEAEPARSESLGD